MLYLKNKAITNSICKLIVWGLLLGSFTYIIIVFLFLNGNKSRYIKSYLQNSFPYLQIIFYIIWIDFYLYSMWMIQFLKGGNCRYIILLKDYCPLFICAYVYKFYKSEVTWHQRSLCGWNNYSLLCYKFKKPTTS